MDQMGIHYNIWIVLLSFVLAATAAYSALNLISQVSHSTGKIRRLWLLSGACVLGSGIWAMHFVSIMASRLPFEVGYHPGRAVLSLLISILSSFLALGIAVAPASGCSGCWPPASFWAAEFPPCIMSECPLWRWTADFTMSQWLRAYL